MALNLEYFRIHNWLNYHHGKASKCENELCKTKNPKRYEWALLKGKEYKKDRNNYIQLCPSCHRKYDFTEQQRINQRMAAIGKIVSKETREKLSVVMKGKNITPVVQKSKDGVVIKSFESVSLAAIETGILQSSISNVLINRSKTAGGFIWEYKHLS